jgi:hypothetical protein
MLADVELERGEPAFERRKLNLRPGDVVTVGGRRDADADEVFGASPPMSSRMSSGASIAPMVGS